MAEPLRIQDPAICLRCHLGKLCLWATGLSPRAVQLDNFFDVQESGFHSGMLSKLMSKGFWTDWALGAWREFTVPLSATSSPLVQRP